MGEGQDALSPAEWKDSGNELYKKGDYRGAIDAYSKAIQADPDDASYYGNRAAASMMLLLHDDVINDCDRALAINPSFSKAFFRKGKALAATGRLDEAVAAYNEGLSKDPKNEGAHKEKVEVESARKALAQARELMQKKRYGQANTLLDIVLNCATQAFPLKVLKMEALMNLNKYEEAFALSNTLMRQNPNMANLLYWRAKCLYYMGNLDSAVKHLQQAVRGDPDNSDVVGLLKKVKLMETKKKEGDEAFKSGRYQDAINAYTACLAVDPSHKSFNAKLYNNRATAYSKLRKHQEAVDDCGKAIALDSGYVKAYKKRAESLYALGGEENLDQCIRDYEEIGRLSPDEEAREIRSKIQQAKVALKRAKRKDYYKVLGVSQDATEEEIRKHYRKKALLYHPDRHSSSTEDEKKEAEKMFKDVAEAYEVLSDKDKKERYDMGADLEDLDDPHAGHGGFHGGHGGIDPAMIFQMFMQHGGGFGGGMGGMGGMGGGMGGQRFHFG